MGTGVLSAAGAPARPRRPRSAMAPAPPLSLGGLGCGRAADARRRAGGPGARKAAARSHGCRRRGRRGEADRPAGGDQAAAAPPAARTPPARAPATPPPTAAHWLGGRALAPSGLITAGAELAGSAGTRALPAGPCPA